MVNKKCNFWKLLGFLNRLAPIATTGLHSDMFAIVHDLLGLTYFLIGLLILIQTKFIPPLRLKFVSAINRYSSTRPGDAEEESGLLKQPKVRILLFDNPPENESLQCSNYETMHADLSLKCTASQNTSSRYAEA